MTKRSVTYKDAGVDIDTADAAKAAMAKSIDRGDPRVLNRVGAFASLVDGRFPGYEEPVMVLKTEEPGSKQKLAIQHGRIESICQDMIHHLINDIAVMGAEPVSVQDAIICGKLEKPIVNRMVDAIAEACRAHGCSLTGGETSEQPGVLEPGQYVLVSSIVGVVDRKKIIDGSRIAEGDVVLAVASNGLHTNGYTLVRRLLADDAALAKQQVAGESFLDAILRPHLCYYNAIKGLVGHEGLHGLAHITGGGIQGNLNRVLPAGVDAVVDLAKVKVLPVFGSIRRAGNVDDADMRRTFNLGVGLTAVVAPAAAEAVIRHFAQAGQEAYPIGSIAAGDRQVRFTGQLRWPQ